MAEIFGAIEDLKGVGKVRGEKYRKIGINTPFDLIYHIPRDYIDFRNFVPVSNIVPNQYNFIKVKILSKGSPQKIRSGLVICKAQATDGSDVINITVFNNVYVFNSLKVNHVYYMYGKVSVSFSGKDINSPTFAEEGEDYLIQPVYRLTQGLTVNVVRMNVRQALDLIFDTDLETLTDSIMWKYTLCPINFALEHIHFPENTNTYESAKKRLAFDELLRLQLGMSLLRTRSRKHTACRMDSSTDISEFMDSLPFQLTDDQMSAVKEITSDLCSDVPMNRLLQGDVGSGKTAVAGAVCFFTAKNGMQSVLMAPTEILAQQHFKTLTSYLEPFGINVCLLTGSLTPKKKAEMREKILSGEYHVIVGTHAVIQKDVEYRSLGLVITDEQHRFGVAQRTALAEKGGTPHRLVMSATPIPRTLALMIYGDLDISVIKQLPNGRKPVKTYAVTGKLRHRAFNFVREQLKSGRQAYVVCPMIEESESDLYAVKSYAENAVKTDLKGYSTALLHGKMKSDEKESVMQDFRDGKTSVLICTTVVEVGVDVPNATVIVIENADRFGLSQLHQLRGRVGRGQYESSCILITDNTSDECVKRMKIMSSNSDGFKISEEDLKMRGPGDFFGNAQHGLPKLKIADIACNTELMSIVQKCAGEILEEDPLLEKPEYSKLKSEVFKLFEKDISG